MEHVRTYEVDQEIPSLCKHMKQERITLFEQSGGYMVPTIHTDVEASKKITGLDVPMASGRMSLSFATECLRRFFGEDVYNRSGVVDLRFCTARAPWRHRDGRGENPFGRPGTEWPTRHDRAFHKKSERRYDRRGTRFCRRPVRLFPAGITPTAGSLAPCRETCR